MIIWFAMVLPWITIGFLAWKFAQRLAWWEYLLLFATPVVLISVSKLIIEKSQVSDTEFWGAYVSRAEYYEAWDEEVSCRHPKYRTVTRTDSKGRSTTTEVFDGYQHMYDVDYHPPCWDIFSSIGECISTSKRDFERLCKQFNNRRFIKMHRQYHSINGDKYEATFDGQPDHLEPVTSKHTYENRVKVSSSVFNYKDVDPKIFGLFEYPEVQNYYQQTLLTHSGVVASTRAAKQLDYYNSVLGSPKKVRMFLLVFHNQPLQAGVDQESYWKGGNKNEFVTCVGVNDQQEIQWTYVFSWSEVESLKIETRDFLQSQKVLNLETFVDWLGPQVGQNFIKKNWHDFDYLTVEPPMWSIFLVFFLTLAVCGGLGYWTVTNDYDLGSGRRGSTFTVWR